MDTHEKKVKERVGKLKQHGFVEEMPRLWKHIPSNKGYFDFYDIMKLDDYNFGVFLKNKSIYSDT